MITEGVWALVPARAGSKRIPNKNVRPLGGLPLVCHVVGTLAGLLPRERIVVSTDDPLVEHLCRSAATVHGRSPTSAGDEATLDEVAVEVASWLLSSGGAPGDILLTVQPTSPFVAEVSLRRALDLAARGGCAVAVREERSLRWMRDEVGAARPLFEKRLNSQWIAPTYVETGAVVAARLGDIVARGTRFVEPVQLLEMAGEEAIDIDSYADWAAAEAFAGRRRVVVRADGGVQLGMGHLYRALALALELGYHHCSIVTVDAGVESLSGVFLRDHWDDTLTLSDEDEFLAYLDAESPDIVVLDVLDTPVSFAREVRRRTSFLVTIENLGRGADVADIVINDLYTDARPKPNHWYGVENSVLASQFEVVQPRPNLNRRVERILLAFGGSDPQNLTAKALRALRVLRFDGEVTVVVGPAYAHPPIDLAAESLRGSVLATVPNMATLMNGADLALTSAGRTVTELMTQGVPTIAICQNMRELLHTHASAPFGIINLGLGEHLEPDELARHIRLLVRDYELRRSLRERMLRAVARRSNAAIARRVLDAYAAQTRGRADGR
jgi:spore coat polysaccharide biosynthesis predicted glycosyltransferase SpsG/CMP-N-acetylneuraminic acid synthetase